MRKSIIFLFIMIVTIHACICHKDTSKANTFNPKLLLEKLAQSKYDSIYKVDYNKTNEFALVYKRYKKFSESIPNLKYFVYSMDNNTIVIEDTLMAGNVYWLNDFAIRAMERGQQAESGRRLYTYDVKRKEYIID